jgi:hypothetical protein
LDSLSCCKNLKLSKIVDFISNLNPQHCTINRTPANTRIVAGTVLLNGGAAPILREVSRIVNHPEYDSVNIAQE